MAMTLTIFIIGVVSGIVISGIVGVYLVGCVVKGEEELHGYEN